MADGARGVVVGLQRSKGGVPKTQVDSAEITAAGMDGDWQQNRKYHGGPERALCLYSMDLIEALQAEGHPIVAGSVGENVTIAGLDWRLMQPGCTVEIGPVHLEVASFAAPCDTIRNAFSDKRFVRIGERRNPGWSRVYVRVVTAGMMRVGDPVTVRESYK